MPIWTILSKAYQYLSSKYSLMYFAIYVSIQCFYMASSATVIASAIIYFCISATFIFSSKLFSTLAINSNKLYILIISKFKYIPQKSSIINNNTFMDSFDFSCNFCEDYIFSPINYDNQPLPTDSKMYDEADIGMFLGNSHENCNIPSLNSDSSFSYSKFDQCFSERPVDEIVLKFQKKPTLNECLKKNKRLKKDITSNQKLQIIKGEKVIQEQKGVLKEEQLCEIDSFEEKKEEKKGLKYIVKKITQLFKKNGNKIPDSQEILDYIYDDMVLGKKQKNYRKNKNYQNLKRRVYDCKNVVVSLVEAIEYKNKMKDDEKYKKIKEEQLMEIKKEFNYLRGMVGKNRLKYKENEELKVIKRLIKCECEMDEE